MTQWLARNTRQTESHRNISIYDVLIPRKADAAISFSFPR